MKTSNEKWVKNRVNKLPIHKMMGMRLLACSGGKSLVTCRVLKDLKNPGGTLHGGVIGVLVDMSTITALRSVLPITALLSTVEYKVNFLERVFGGVITARGSVIRSGKTTAVCTTEIRNAAGDPVAFGSATFYILNVRTAEDYPGITSAATRRRATPRSE